MELNVTSSSVISLTSKFNDGNSLHRGKKLWGNNWFENTAKKAQTPQWGHTTYLIRYETVKKIKESYKYNQKNSKYRPLLSVVQNPYPAFCLPRLEQQKKFWRGKYCLVVSDQWIFQAWQLLFQPRL